MQKWHDGPEASNRCFYGDSYLLCLFIRDFHKNPQKVCDKIKYAPMHEIQS